MNHTTALPTRLLRRAARIDSTVVPSWLLISVTNVTVPRVGFVAEGRASSTVVRADSRSPGRTGASQRICSTPGDPRLIVRFINPSTMSRMHIEQVCQPEAMMPPNVDSAAAAGSMWNGCGSNRVAKSMISSSVTATLPSSNTRPGVKSSK